MFRSKADRILSRYRPIAPKPLPLPVSGSLATDVSSTCASLDSFTSSGKARRLRKRRIASSSPGKFLKTPRSDRSPIVSALSNSNAGASASSLTQGNSDMIVPHTDFSFVSQTCGAHVSTSHHMAMDVPAELPRVPSGDPAMLATPFNHNLAGNLVEQARMFMVADARKARQQPSVPLPSFSRSSPGYGGGGAGIEKDLGFMERAAASIVLPDRAAPAGLSCSPVCMKGVGYSSGGFTELIRGITRLPTAADVQSLMHARTGMPAMESGMMPSSTESITCDHTLPVHSEAHPPCPELHSAMPAAIPCWAAGSSPREDEADDQTLPLLPNLPSKASLSMVRPQAESSVYDSSYKLELATDIRSADFNAELTIGSSSAANLPASFTSMSRGAGVQSGITRQGNTESDDTELRPPSCSGHVPRVLSGLASSCASSALSRDGSSVDQVYLEQVYGGSTDPVLLVDDNRQVLWCNRAYDRALKSVSERLSGMPAAAGPYIDPLGHPTPLGSFVLNQTCSTSRFVNCTLWGFLRKLVMPEVDGSPSMIREMKVDKTRQEMQLEEDEGTSSLRFSNGEMASARVMQGFKRGGEMKAAKPGCGGVGRLTSITLESITEVYTEEGLALFESVESAEARLGAAGSVPAFITDCACRVRWVNTAFKQMLGHTEQQQSSHTMMAMTPNKGGGPVKHESPDLTFVCSAEKIPRASQAFSGLVNVEWIKAGKRRSMTVPCDVTRLVPAASWVWKFDLPLSLSLNFCV